MGSKTKRKSSSFVNQAAILAVAGIFARILGFLYRLPLTNMIGDTGNGIYSAGYYLYNFFLVMSSAGLPVAISKMVSEKITLGEIKNANKIFKVSMIVSASLGLLFSLIMFFGAQYFCVFIKSERSYYSILTLSPTVFIVAVLAVYRGYFQGMGTMVPTALSQVIEQIFNAVFSVYLAWLFMVYMGLDVEFGAAGGTAGTGVGALAGLLTIAVLFHISRGERLSLSKLDKGGYRIETGKEITKNLMKIAVPVIAGTAIFSMTNLIDMIMVNSRLSAIGLYSQTEIDALYGQLTGKYVTLTTLPVVISTALATAVIPSISASVAKKEAEVVKSKIDTALRLTMIISIPAAVGIGALGDQILMLLFPNYADGGNLLRYGAVSIIFLALSQISTGVLQGIGKVKVPAWNALIGSICKIPVNYVLIAIPSINIVGAVISTTVCYMVASGLNFRALVKATSVKPDYIGMLVKPSIASLVMAFGCIYGYKYLYMLSHSNTVSTFIAIILAIILYAVTMIAIKGFKREELRLIPMGTKIINFLEKIGRI